VINLFSWATDNNAGVMTDGFSLCIGILLSGVTGAREKCVARALVKLIAAGIFLFLSVARVCFAVGDLNARKFSPITARPTILGHICACQAKFMPQYRDFTYGFDCQMKEFKMRR